MFGGSNKTIISYGHISAITPLPKYSLDFVWLDGLGLRTRNVSGSKAVSNLIYTYFTFKTKISKLQI
jgi:hypothetical protein